MKPLIVFAVCGFITLNVGASIMMKIGATAPAARRLLFGLAGWEALVGVGLFGLSAIAYTVALRYLPLNLAQSFAALQFVGVILAAAVILSEPISVTRWLGIALIAVGILIVGFAGESQ
tara:strand:+ start:1026 stop:1382 length:357 start_codon:yes stop_codon:yes gene_type:complete